MAAAADEQLWSDDSPGTRVTRTALEFRDALADASISEVLIDTVTISINDTAVWGPTISITRNVTIRARDMAQNRYPVINIGTAVRSAATGLGSEGEACSSHQSHAARWPTCGFPLINRMRIWLSTTAGYAVFHWARLLHDLDRHRREWLKRAGETCVSAWPAARRPRDRAQWRPALARQLMHRGPHCRPQSSSSACRNVNFAMCNLPSAFIRCRCFTTMRRWDLGCGLIGFPRVPG